MDRKKTLFKDDAGNLHVLFSERDTSGPRAMLRAISPTAIVEINRALYVTYAQKLLKDMEEEKREEQMDIIRSGCLGDNLQLSATDERRLDFVCSYYYMLLWQIIRAKKERRESLVINTDISQLDSADIVERAGADMALLLYMLDINDQKQNENKTLFSGDRSVYDATPKDSEGYAEFILDDIREEYTQGTLFEEKPKRQTYKIIGSGEIYELPRETTTGKSTTYMTDVPFETGMNALKIENGNIENAVIVVQRTAKRQNVEVEVTLTNNGNEVPIEKIDGTDWLIFEALGNIYLGNGERTKIDNNGTAFATTEQIYKEMKKKVKGKVNAASLAEIDARIKRLAQTWIEISYGKQAKALHMSCDTPKIMGNLISVIGIEMNIYGTEVHGWEIDRIPLVYSYANALGRIMTVPKGILVEGSLYMAKIQRALHQLTHMAAQDRPTTKKKKSKSASILLYKLVKRADYPFDGNAPANRHPAFIKGVIEDVKNILGQMKSGKAILDYDVTNEKTPSKCKITVHVAPEEEKK